MNAIFDFFKNETLKSDLNITNITILLWTKLFIEKSKENPSYQKNINGENILFYRVKYNEVIQELSFLKIKDQRAMAHHFDAIVEEGCLVKHLKVTPLGSFPCFAVPIEQNKPEDITNPNALVLPTELESNPCDVLEDPVGDVIEDPVGDVVENPVSDVVENPVGDVVENPVGDVFEKTSASLFKNSVENSSSSFLSLMNLNINKEAAALNILNKTLMKEELLKISNNLFFDEEFYVRSVSYMQNKQLDLGYISWLYENKVKVKKPDSERNYFYSIFCKDDICLEYQTFVSTKTEVKITPIATKKIVCCICNTVSENGEEICSHCMFEYSNSGSSEAVARHKLLFSLDKETQKKYYAELENIDALIRTSGGSLSSLTNKLYNKYGISFKNMPPAQVMNY